MDTSRELKHEKDEDKNEACGIWLDLDKLVWAVC